MLILSIAPLMVKSLPTVQDIQVPSLGQKNPLEKRMATHSSILAWGILWTEEPGGLWTHRVTKSRTWLRASHFLFSHFLSRAFTRPYIVLILVLACSLIMLPLTLLKENILQFYVLFMISHHRAFAFIMTPTRTFFPPLSV